MSVLDRALTAIKDVMLLREQMKELRGDVAALTGDFAGLVDDLRDLDRRVARLEGATETMRLLAARSPRLPPE
jgi:hypothetical protein